MSQEKVLKLGIPKGSLQDATINLFKKIRLEDKPSPQELFS